jgi:tryptophan synthase alpha subunit
MVKDARQQGLKAPVLLMGYYNPLRAYGEEKLLRDCKEASVNGFIVVDLPPEEAVSFRKLCTKGGYDNLCRPSLVYHKNLLANRDLSFLDCRISP